MTAHRMRSPGPIRQVPVGASGAGPYAITNGPDGALWIAPKRGPRPNRQVIPWGVGQAWRLASAMR